MKFHLLLPILIAALALVSCGHSYEYETDIALPDTGWLYADSLQARFDIQDTSAIYNLYLSLEHSTAFPYQNFYVRIRTRFPDGQLLTEQVSLELANKIGVWLGDCNADACQLRIPLQEGAYFNQPGAYQLAIEQFSRDNPLQGIQHIGFHLEKTDKRK